MVDLADLRKLAGCTLHREEPQWTGYGSPVALAHWLDCDECLCIVVAYIRREAAREIEMDKREWESWIDREWMLELLRRT